MEETFDTSEAEAASGGNPAFGVLAAAAALDLSPAGLKTLIRAGLLPGPAVGFAQARFDAAWLSGARSALARGREAARSALLAEGIALPAALRIRVSVAVTPFVPGVKNLPDDGVP